MDVPAQTAVQDAARDEVSAAGPDRARLLPCPFCGETPRVHVSNVFVSFVCPPGSACDGSGLAVLRRGVDAEAAVSGWNGRVGFPPGHRAAEGEPLPCPFTGNVPLVRTGEKYTIIMPAMDDHGDLVGLGAVYRGTSRADAVAAWNVRAAHGGQPANRRRNDREHL